MSASSKLLPRAKSSSNIARLELDYLERFGTYTRLHYENRSCTNIEELLHAARLARVLRDRGVLPGDRVLVLLPNTPDLTASFQAIWSMGAVMCPIMPQWTAAEIAHVLNNSGATAVLTSPALAARVRDAAEGIASVQHRLVLGETDVASMEDISPELDSAATLDSPVNRSPEDLALLLYTSGTTAEPKGVMITHANVAAAIESANALNPDLPSLPMLHVLPLTHVFGLLMLKLANRWGLTSVLLREFDPLMIFETIERYRVGYMPVVPTMLVYLLHHPERGKFSCSSLYRITSGGAALPEKLRADFESAFHCRVDQGYGMSESVAIATSYGDHDRYCPGSAGRAEPGVDLRILDAHNQPMPGNVSGEICLAGANIAAGYWNNLAATNEAFAGGWFHTGDVGFLDEDGYLHITDRKKDLIIKGGENISPREIEEALYLHPAVAEAAVIGIPDSLFGEEICAVVQLKPGSQASAEEVRSHVAQHLTKFKVPRDVVFQAALPKNSTGKIQKRAIKEKFSAEWAA
jgi:long-chain acyl-CoA synthetase